MKRTSTFLGLLLLLTTVASGQTSEKNNKPYKVNNPLEALNRESLKDSHTSSRQINRKPAQSSFLQSTLANKQKLDSVIAQSWNDTISQLKKTFKVEYRYNSDGHEIQDNSFQWDGSKWINYYLNTYTNDANGNRIQTIENHWDGSQWIEDYKSEYRVDSIGNTTQSIIYNKNADQWVNQEKVEYAYDSIGNMTQELIYNWVENQWVHFYASKYEYSYDSIGNMTQSIQTHLNGNQWGNSAKYEYSWDSIGNQTQYIYYFWDGTQWLKSAKSESILDSNGNEIQNIIFNWDGINWVRSSKTERTFDLSYSLPDLIVPFYMTYTQMLTSQSAFEWNYFTNDWSMVYKFIYYYSEQIVNGVSEINNEKFNVYPNPATDHLSINYSDNYRPIIFELYDIQGRRLMSREIKSNGTISLKSFQNGMYIYHLTIDEKKQSGKLLKK